MGEEDGAPEATQFSLVFPHVVKRTEIVMNEFLNWRLVSKTWRDTIDDYLENMSSMGDLRMNLAKLDKLRACVPEMEAHPDNPFVGRRVFLHSYQRPEEEEDEYWSKCLHLFSKKGEHVHYITLCTESSPLQFSQLLRAILSYLPNLKEVFFYYWHPDPEYLIRPKEEVFAELDSYFETNPFPALESFQKFHFHTMDFPKPIQDAIITTYGTQLRSLGVREWDLDYVPQLKNVNDLFLTMNDNSELESLLRLEIPLETFILLLNMQEVDIALLFQVLESFGETLTFLELYFLAETTVSSAAEMLNLPKLKHLEIRNMRFLSLSFLPSLGGSLKRLSLKSEEMLPDQDGVEDENDGGIQIRGYTGKMYESNIWQLLPKLEVLNVGNNDEEVADEKDIVTKTYTRQMYEFLNKLPEHTG